MESNTTSSEQVTTLLRAWQSGDSAALGELITLIYPDLRQLAIRFIRGESKEHTLSATALVNETYLKMVSSSAHWQDRAHLLAASVHIMRNILVDYAKSKRRVKRGGWTTSAISLNTVGDVSVTPEESLVDLDEALERLAKSDPRKARLIELLYFGGLSEIEAAQVLGISRSTLQRDRRTAKAWLSQALKTPN